MRMWEEGRTKPITIICQKELVEFFEGFTDMAYKGFSEKFKFKINFIGAKAGNIINFQDLELLFAPTIHSIENLAISISDSKNKICYSGDGQFTKETEELYKNSDLLIQETYLYDQVKLGHACIKDTILMAESQNIKCLALTHMQRDFRKNELPKLKDSIKSDTVKIIIPEPMQEYDLSD